MANAYTLSEVQTFLPTKTWGNLPDEMKKSATAYLTAPQDQPNAERLIGYYLIVPTFRTDELAALVEGRSSQLRAVMLNNADQVLPIDIVTDQSTFGYAHEFLSGLTICFVNDSEFPKDTSGI